MRIPLSARNSKSLSVSISSAEPMEDDSSTGEAILTLTSTQWSKESSKRDLTLLLRSMSLTKKIQDQQIEIETRIRQTTTPPLSKRHHIAKLQLMYADLFAFEAKCIEVDNKQAVLAEAQAPGWQTKLKSEHWQVLVALHEQLLFKHRDLLLATQHPSAALEVRRLVGKNRTIDRMWNYGIYEFFELLRCRLPASTDAMLTFLHLAYSIMTSLYQTVEIFANVWAEFLGDLARVMAFLIPREDAEFWRWIMTAYTWYLKASIDRPLAGHLYHHLAVLTPPNTLQQLFYFAKSLCVGPPAVTTRSIMTLFEAVESERNTAPPLDTAFVKAHGILFRRLSMRRTIEEFLDLLDGHIGHVTHQFLEQGHCIAIANIAAMLEFGANDNILMKVINPSKDDNDAIRKTVTISAVPPDAEYLTNRTLRIIFERIGDRNVLPCIHVTLVFMFHLSRADQPAIALLEANFPWDSLVTLLNELLGDYKESTTRIESDAFPMPTKEDHRLCPEDFAMRGLPWTESYFPKEWFTDENKKLHADEIRSPFTHEKVMDQDYVEVESMVADQRVERILWLGCRLGDPFGPIKYNKGSVKPRFSIRGSTM